MTPEGKDQGQLPFSWELGIDLDTGKPTLRRRRSRKPAGGQTKQPAPTKPWWDTVGLMAFHGAAEGWRQKQSAIFAEEFGYNAEFAGPQMREAETEESLKRAFWAAKRSSITSLDVVKMMKGESLNLEERLGTGANWLPGYVDVAINWLAEVYRLKSVTTEGLKKFAHQRQLPQFS